MDFKAIYKMVIEGHSEQSYGAMRNHYVAHLIMTDLMLLSYFPERYNDDTRAAALLHDYVEDAGEDWTDHVKLMQANASERTCELVNMLTEKRISCGNRRDRQERSYRVIAQDEDAIAIKLSDRLANTYYACFEGNEKMLSMYRKEMEFFKKSFYDEEDASIVSAFRRIESHLK